MNRTETGHNLAARTKEERDKSTLTLQLPAWLIKNV